MNFLIVVKVSKYHTRVNRCERFSLLKNTHIEPVFFDCKTPFRLIVECQIYFLYFVRLHSKNVCAEPFFRVSKKAWFNNTIDSFELHDYGIVTFAIFFRVQEHDLTMMVRCTWTHVPRLNPFSISIDVNFCMLTRHYFFVFIVRFFRKITFKFYCSECVKNEFNTCLLNTATIFICPAF